MILLVFPFLSLDKSTGIFMPAAGRITGANVGRGFRRRPAVLSINKYPVSMSQITSPGPQTAAAALVLANNGAMTMPGCEIPAWRQ